MKIERRRGTVSLVESNDSEKMPTIRGLAAPFDQICDEPIWDEFYEMIQPGAFKRALADKKTNCVAVVQHNDSYLPVARFKGGKGSLRLQETKEGLEFELEPPNTEAGRALVEALKRGDIDGMSFAFRTVADRWDGTHNGKRLRVLEDLELHDVSFVTNPAYGGTYVDGMRGEMDAAEYRALSAKHQGTTKQQRERKLRLLELTKNQ